MTKHFLTIPAVLIAIGVASPRVAQAQTFKVQKYSIGGDGGTDYLTAEPGTGRVFVSRSTHVMVVDGMTGKVLGDIPDAPRNHGTAVALDAASGDIVGTAQLEDTGPEGAASDGKGKLFVNNEGTSTMQVLDA